MPNTQTLSPEARSLIERSINWLTPKGRWTKGWGVFKVKTPNGPNTIELDEMDDLLDKKFTDFEREYELPDPDSPYGITYDYNYPLENRKEPDASCLVGSLIINNNYEQDKVFEEAVLFLESLAVKSGKIDLRDNCMKQMKQRYRELDMYTTCYCRKCSIERGDNIVEEAIENLVSLNDSSNYSPKRHVLDLFRRAIRRK